MTGGAGFIGSHLTERLVEAGAQVRVLDNLSSGNEKNLSAVRQLVDFHRADLRDASAVDLAVSGCEVVFHLGANACVPKSVEDRACDFSTNTVGSFHVADAVIRHRVRRLVYVSTAAVYGPPRTVPVSEEAPCEPISPYGGSKLAADRLLISYARTFGFELALLRLFNTYGPRQPRYVIHDLIRKLQADPTRLEVLGSGEQRRDYCYIADTVEALLLAATTPAPSPLVLNVSGGRTISIRELTGLLLQTLGLTETEVHFGQPSWKGDIDVLSGDISRLRALGWCPRVDLPEGLGRTAAYFLGRDGIRR